MKTGSDIHLKGKNPANIYVFVNWKLENNFAGLS